MEHDLFTVIFNPFLCLGSFCSMTRVDPSTVETDICLHPTGELRLPLTWPFDNSAQRSCILGPVPSPSPPSLPPSLLLLPSFLPSGFGHLVTPVKHEPTPVKTSSAGPMPSPVPVQTTKCSFLCLLPLTCPSFQSKRFLPSCVFNLFFYS